MSKDYKAESSIPDEKAPLVFVSSKGVTIRLKPVSQFKINTLRTSKVEVPVPTYTVGTVGGDVQEFELDAVVAENKGRMDEWNAYLSEKQKQDNLFGERFTDLLIWDGVDVEVPGADSDWQKTCDYLGIAIPDHPIKRKSAYVQNELLSAVEDMGDLAASIMAASHTPEEQVRRMRESFRVRVRRASNTEVRETQEPVENA